MFAPVEFLMSDSDLACGPQSGRLDLQFESLTQTMAQGPFILPVSAIATRVLAE